MERKAMTPLQIIIRNGIETPRKEYIQERYEEFKGKYPLLKDLTEDLVDELFTVCDQDKNLSADNPPEYFQIIEDVCSDIEDTKALLNHRLQVKELDFASGYQRVREKFEFGEKLTGLTPRQGATINTQDLEIALAVGFAMENSGQWVVADAVAHLEDMGEDDVVNQVCAQLNRAYPTVSAWSRTGRKVPKELRPRLCFTAFNEICTARIHPEDKNNDTAILELLNTAVEEGWSSTEARNQVRHARNPSEEGIKRGKPRYLIILSGEPLFTHEEPVWSEGALIFDLKDQKVLKEIDKKIDWYGVEVSL